MTAPTTTVSPSASMMDPLHHPANYNNYHYHTGGGVSHPGQQHPHNHHGGNHHYDHVPPYYNAMYNNTAYHHHQNASRKRQRRQAAGTLVQNLFQGNHHHGGGASGGGGSPPRATQSSQQQQQPGTTASGKKSTAQPRPQIQVPPRGIGPVYEPNVNDVLCGRGGRINAHQGNVQFRTLVLQRKKDYLAKSTKKLAKAHIANEIVQQIRSHNPSGRFLKEDPDGSWYDIGDAKAIKKVGQALREDAPDIRQEIKEDNSSGEENENNNNNNEDDKQPPQPNKEKSSPVATTSSNGGGGKPTAEATASSSAAAATNSNNAAAAAAATKEPKATNNNKAMNPPRARTPPKQHAAPPQTAKQQPQQAAAPKSPKQIVVSARGAKASPANTSAAAAGRRPQQQQQQHHQTSKPFKAVAYQQIGPPPNYASSGNRSLSGNRSVGGGSRRGFSQQKQPHRGGPQFVQNLVGGGMRGMGMNRMMQHKAGGFSGAAQNAVDDFADMPPRDIDVAFGRSFHPPPRGTGGSDTGGGGGGSMISGTSGGRPNASTLLSGMSGISALTDPMSSLSGQGGGAPHGSSPAAAAAALRNSSLQQIRQHWAQQNGIDPNTGENLRMSELTGTKHLSSGGLGSSLQRSQSWGDMQSFLRGEGNEWGAGSVENSLIGGGVRDDSIIAGGSSLMSGIQNFGGTSNNSLATFSMRGENDYGSVFSAGAGVGGGIFGSGRGGAAGSITNNSIGRSRTGPITPESSRDRSSSAGQQQHYYQQQQQRQQQQQQDRSGSGFFGGGASLASMSLTSTGIESLPSMPGSIMSDLSENLIALDLAEPKMLDS